jgi:hypothetical protein
LQRTQKNRPKAVFLFAKQLLLGRSGWSSGSSRSGWSSGGISSRSGWSSSRSSGFNSRSSGRSSSFFFFAASGQSNGGQQSGEQNGFGHGEFQ